MEVPVFSLPTDCGSCLCLCPPTVEVPVFGLPTDSGSVCVCLHPTVEVPVFSLPTDSSSCLCPVSALQTGDGCHRCLLARSHQSSVHHLRQRPAAHLRLCAGDGAAPWRRHLASRRPVSLHRAPPCGDNVALQADASRLAGGLRVARLNATAAGRATELTLSRSPRSSGRTSSTAILQTMF